VALRVKAFIFTVGGQIHAQSGIESRKTQTLIHKFRHLGGIFFIRSSAFDPFEPVQLGGMI
jgi:hypothetical protein